MIELLVFAFIATGLMATDFRASVTNIGMRWNGLGAIEETIARTNEAPMRYRVLIPAIVRGLSGGNQRREIWAYFAVKHIGLWVACAAMYLWIGFGGALFTAVLMAMTFWFDYADYAWEVAAIAVMYVCIDSLTVMTLIVILWSLMRESALFAVVIVASHAMFIEAGVLLWFYAVVRYGVIVVQGRTKSYCTLKQIYKLNNEWRKGVMSKDRCYEETLLYALHSMWAFTLLIVITIGAFDVAHWYLIIPAAAMFGAALIWGRWREVRVYLTPSIPLVAYGVMLYG